MLGWMIQIYELILEHFVCVCVLLLNSFTYPDLVRGPPLDLILSWSTLGLAVVVVFGRKW